MDHYQRYGHDLSAWMSSIDVLEQVVAGLLTQEGITLRCIHNSPSVDFFGTILCTISITITDAPKTQRNTSQK